MEMMKMRLIGGPFVYSAAPLPFHFPFHFTVRHQGAGGDGIKSRLFCYSSNNNDDAGAAAAGGGGGGEQEEYEDWVTSPGSASPYHILGLDPTSTPISPSQLKAAFRARVKQFHPDVCKEITNADEIIQHVIRSYKILSKRHNSEDTAGECLDPFEEPECEAFDLFVNEVQCIGKGCPYSCVQRAPCAFAFTAENGTARATSQVVVCVCACVISATQWEIAGHGDDYQVQLAVGQCPKRCIHYVTPSQRAQLDDLLCSMLDNPYDMGEAALLESLIMKATLENKRYQKPKRRPRASTEHVDWC